MLRRVVTFCRPLRPVLLLVSFPRSRSPVVGVLGLCWMWHGVPFARQRRPIIGVLRLCWLLPGSFDCFCCPHTFVHRPSIACLAVCLCAPSPPRRMYRRNPKIGGGRTVGGGGGGHFAQGAWRANVPALRHPAAVGQSQGPGVRGVGQGPWTHPPLRQMIDRG